MFNRFGPFMAPVSLGLTLVAALAGCPTKHSTAPNGNSIAGTYTGVLSNMATSGQFKAVLGSPVNTAASGPFKVRDAAARSGTDGSHFFASERGSTNNASVTITLINGVSLTLTGSTSGNNFTVSDNLGDQCSGSVANFLNATCNLTLMPGAFTLAGALQAVQESGSGLTSYCGLEYSASNPNIPQASLLIGVAGSQTFAARVDGTRLLLFGGPVDSVHSSFVDTLVTPGYINRLYGTYTSSSAMGEDSLHESESSLDIIVGNWTAATPCTLITGSMTPTHMTFTATSNGIAPASQSAVVTPKTLGPIVATINPAVASWLFDTTSFDTLKISLATSLPPGTYTALVSVYPQFASNAPLIDTITYVVNSSNGGTVTAGLWVGNSDGQLLNYTISSLAQSNASPAISTGSGAASGVGFLAVDGSGDLWLSSAFRGAIFLIPPTNFLNGNAGGGFTVKLTPPTPSGGRAPAPTGIAFDQSGNPWVADSANAGYLYSFSATAQTGAAPTATVWIKSIRGFGNALGDTKFSGMAFDANGNLWVGDQGNSTVLMIRGNHLVDGDTLADGYLELPSGSGPQSLAFDLSGNLWVSGLGQGALYEFTASQLATVTGQQTVNPNAVVSVTGVSDSVNALAFDTHGNLWIVESANTNANTGLAMIPAASLTNESAQYAVTPTVTFAENGAGPQLPTSIAFDPIQQHVGLNAAVGAPRIFRKH